MQIASAGPDSTALKWAEQHEYQADMPLGLSHVGARQYDSFTGRFLSRDPIGFAGGFNLYSYCGNDPVNHVDPSGLISPGDIIGGIGVGISWAEAGQNPNPSTIGWAIVDTITELIPGIPGTSVRHGEKLLKIGRRVAGTPATRAVRRVVVAAKKVSCPKRIVIGENMERVHTAARKLGAETFGGSTMAENEAWIAAKIAQGYEVYDIGPAFKRRLDRYLDPNWKEPYFSKYYNMERRKTKGYDRYHRLWTRDGKWQGGARGIDAGH
jgi:RHS repeat-associated protein